MNTGNPNIQIRSGPVYLVALTNAEQYLAVRIDEAQHTLKMIGIILTIPAGTEIIQFMKNLPKDHGAILSAAGADEYVEISFPWHQILSIKNLNYRKKDNK